LFKARRSKKFRAVGEEESEFKTSVDMMGFWWYEWDAKGEDLERGI
jgi:hypothetical protein